MESERLKPVLLYDGVCGFCDRTVRTVLRLDRAARIRFAPLQGGFASSVLKRHPSLDGVDSLVLVEPSDDAAIERVHVRTEAVLRVAYHLGGVWRTLALLRLVPRPLRDALYDAVARRRYQMFGRFETCPFPDPEVRSRFLD